jgi:long-chain acyl-CoA synthetase
MEKLWFKSYAPGIPHIIKIDEVTISDAVTRSAGDFPKKDALIFLDAKISFKKLDELVNRFANALLDMGVKKGDKIAMLMPNMPQLVIANCAAWRVGAVVVMNNPLYTDTELEHQLNNSESSVLVTLDLLAKRMIALKPKTKLRKIVVVHLKDHLGFPKKQLLPIVAKDKHAEIPRQADVLEWSDLMAKYPSKNPGIKVDFKSLACLQYTGGTTGVSKGAMLTHSNLSSNVQQVAAWFPQFKRGELVGIGALPFFHVFGLTCCMNIGLWQGWTGVLIPRPEPAPILQEIQKYKADSLVGVPTLYVAIMNHPDLKKYNISSLKLCTSGAGPLPVEVLNRFAEITGSKISEGYGLTESSPVVTSNPHGGVLKPGSIGLPYSNTDIKIVDVETGTKEMKVGEAGEIIIKGPQVMQGYYKMKEETANTLKDGWLYTGDIAKMDQDGYCYIVDRKKDMIIAGGYNIYPRDIDEILYAHPKIRDACAIGVPDSYRGETVKVFVVPKSGETLTEKEVIEYCKSKLAAYKVPKMVEFLDALPTSAVGKVLRKELRQRELDKAKKN